VTGNAVSGDTAQSGQTAVYVAAAVGLAAVAAVSMIVVSARTEANFVRDVISRLSDDSYANDLASIIEEFVADVQNRHC
jgi:hypothetical protein